MSESKRGGGIEIEQDVKFQSRSWKVQRTGWKVMLLLSALALLGVFGNGPLSNARAGDDSFRIEYERFVRARSDERLTIAIGVPSSSTVSLWIDRAWLTDHEVKNITPVPDRTSAGSDRVTYEFSVDSTARPARIEFDFETQEFGVARGRVGITGGRFVSFTQFAYP